MSWNVKYLVLILLTTVLSYAAAFILDSTENKKVRKLCVAGTFVICIGILFVFKYFNFVIDSIVALMNVVSIKVHPVTLNLLLPVGISFYTFQTLSYVVDVYRKKIKAEKNFGKYAAFVSFFPQLVAGPIERTENLLSQIKNECIFNYEQATYGLKLMAWGFYKKIIVADTLAGYVDKVYGSINTYSGFSLIIASTLFAFQIYCDFSGYSDIAIGSAKLLGINLMRNFHAPYFATSVKDFWSRWHISLSTWFRDYLYIPLGGNRCGKAKQYRNLLVTFCLSGLWHGANWTYLLWGFLHGVGQIIENICMKIGKQKNKPIHGHSTWYGWSSMLLVFCFTVITWVFFRANSIQDALYVFLHAFDGISDVAQYIISGLKLVFVESVKLIEAIVMLSILMVFDYFSLKVDVIDRISEMKLIPRWGVYVLFMFTMLALMPVNSGGEFIYFQF